MSSLFHFDSGIRQYALITANYWAFTLTDGALRMLIVLYFYQLGYSPLAIAMLFIFYELFGVVTNLLGGWLGARFGLNNTMHCGMALQCLALAMLLVPAGALTELWVMVAQALSGVAKDLNKMSAKSAIKFLIPDGAEGRLFRWVAWLTGSKNTLKGCGFFLGGVLLTVAGFQWAIASLLLALLAVGTMSLVLLKGNLGKAKRKPKLTRVLSTSRAINSLSAARLFLFASRDVWFVIALPVYLGEVMGWEHSSIGALLALWIIFYGLVQGLAPTIIEQQMRVKSRAQIATFWSALLLLVPALILLVLQLDTGLSIGLVISLLIFALVFAVNSSYHSFLIVQLASKEAVSMDVGFYYMANASGRLLGTVLSGLLYQYAGLSACMAAAVVLILATVFLSRFLADSQADAAVQ